MTKAVMITGTHSGVGKTTVSLGLMAALTRRGMSVQPFKVGPDFIDPSHHTAISGNPSMNLDSYIMGTKGVCRTFAKYQNSDISIIEGVMGLYDGIESTQIASSAHVAKTLGIPVLLVINVHGMSRSAAAVAKGYQMLDPDVNIAGLVLNQVGSPRHRKLVEDALKAEGIDIPVIGSLPSNRELFLPSRHLGLYMAHEQMQDYDKLADFIDANVDMNALLGISSIPDIPKNIKKINEDGNTEIGKEKRFNVIIGVAMDGAFCFYYQEMMDELQKLGAKLVFFSPMSDDLPDIDGLILGGGYPELFPAELSSGSALTGIRKATVDGMPIYAECGGLMYLGKSLEIEGHTYKMAGVLDARSSMVGRFQALGYTEAEVVCDNPLSLKGQVIRGHEFHYSITECDRDARFAYSMNRGKGIEDAKDGLMVYNTLAGYMHTHPASASMERFVDMCREYSRR
ncbi:MAG: cobyrinate a,c-diamide synthase [ANME-2 cluster archaeon]|nr:cobyrinate a,c-diamide synthase [ANME-2 cluster archaeon]MBC2707811.1 cobyrinate a,c-diamide synthase [ANME-2 cluster archaeon]MBC2747842.1 cobyrinate a,c-diamide synthase [ANME-2 cluster archaeon]MBC2762473.1 cobyrinate a,c-diamide synthase [ANME-2 cluster archaeon]